MTTTHTFHGLNTESRSSSRVLNPPGGLSNNIFGSDNQVKHSCVGSNTAVSREKSDNVGPGAAVKTAGPQQKPWAPRSGDDSIHTSFGIYPSSGCDKAPSNIRVSLLVPGAVCPRRLNSRSNQNKADTFRNIFGEDRSVQYRKMFRRVHNVSDDSFSRVFGQKSLNEESHQRKDVGPTPSHMSISSMIQGSQSPKSGDQDLLTPMAGDARCPHIRPSHSVYTNFGSKSMRLDTPSSVCQAFSSSASLSKNIPLFRRFPLSSAFNPITGELYDQPKPKSEPQLNVTPSSEICNNTPVDVVQLPAVTAVAPVVENIQPEPAEIAQPVPVEVAQPVPAEVAPPVAADEPGAQEKPQASQSGRMFGESAEGAKPHSSTRVSQPPGGHSSKLW